MRGLLALYRYSDGVSDDTWDIVGAQFLGVISSGFVQYRAHVQSVVKGVHMSKHDKIITTTSSRADDGERDSGIDVPGFRAASSAWRQVFVSYGQLVFSAFDCWIQFTVHRYTSVGVIRNLD